MESSSFATILFFPFCSLRITEKSTVKIRIHVERISVLIERNVSRRINVIVAKRCIIFIKFLLTLFLVNVKFIISIFIPIIFRSYLVKDISINFVFNCIVRMKRVTDDLIQRADFKWLSIGWHRFQKSDETYIRSNGAVESKLTFSLFSLGAVVPATVTRTRFLPGIKPATLN